ncbi:MAG TPA: CmpA/NrtA family ABC transporter substrate-binding protein [Rhizomicrobium sp.]|nr:CmpA/NrtA family ABC transporter substrate-binding protein [Rhizomicrobium sp.]
MSTSKLTIGLLRLTDSAPAIVAHELGFFADEGVDTEIVVEPSWANIADKLAYGFLDAAVIVPPLAFAVALGLRGGRAEPLIIPFNISLGGNTVTFANDLAQETAEIAARDNKTIPEAVSACLRPDREPVMLAVVHSYSTHNLLLRYWLATGGVVGGRDVMLSVVPPALAVEALKSGRIAGFCAGAPWGEVAERHKLGRTVATSHDIWRNAPEKALAVRECWATENPDTLNAALRALLRAAKFCDAPENASYTAALLSRQKYLGVDSHAILSSLPGGARTPRTLSVFYRHAANFPWRSHALWFLDQMKRWGLVDAHLNAKRFAERVYRPDIYRTLASACGEPVPLADSKIEGAHTTAWLLDAAPSPIAMDADQFCDRSEFGKDV